MEEKKRKEKKRKEKKRKEKKAEFCTTVFVFTSKYMLKVTKRKTF